MRVAILADIHGNLTAFDAVLQALAQEHVDQMVCLGDVAIFGPQPQATLQRLQTLGCPVVMGNTDAWALAPTPHPWRNEETPRFNDIELWGAQQLTAAALTFIRTFQPTVALDLGETTLLCYHGSPRSYHDPIVATTTDIELAPLLGDTTAHLLAGGHTHQPYVRRYRNQWLLNPGSVGLPFEHLPDGAVRNPPWAEYALVTQSAQQSSIELRQVPYDLDALIAAVHNSAMPHADWWLGDWR